LAVFSQGDWNSAQDSIARLLNLNLQAVVPNLFEYEVSFLISKNFACSLYTKRWMLHPLGQEHVNGRNHYEICNCCKLNQILFIRKILTEETRHRLKKQILLWRYVNLQSIWYLSPWVCCSPH
jgi:hypothetical protein